MRRPPLDEEGASRTGRARQARTARPTARQSVCRDAGAVCSKRECDRRLALPPAAVRVLLGAICMLQNGSSSAPAGALQPETSTARPISRNCAFGFALIRNGMRGAGARSAVPLCGTRSLVCLNNERNRPPPDTRFMLRHSPYEGKFVPINEQMTFTAEMEALDALDQEERALVLGELSDEEAQQKFDSEGDVTWGLRIEVARDFSTKSAEARARWQDPEYRHTQMRKREKKPGHQPANASAPLIGSARHSAAASVAQARALPALGSLAPAIPDTPPPQRRLPRLHELLQTDAVAWSPEGGGWAGTGTLLREEEATGGAKGATAQKGGKTAFGAGGKGAKMEGPRTVAAEREAGKERKRRSLKLLRSDQNQWMAQRLEGGEGDGGGGSRARRGSVAHRLEKQARYREAARQRESEKRARKREQVKLMRSTEDEVGGTRRGGGLGKK